MLHWQSSLRNRIISCDCHFLALLLSDVHTLLLLSSFECSSVSLYRMNLRFIWHNSLMLNYLQVLLYFFHINETFTIFMPTKILLKGNWAEISFFSLFISKIFYLTFISFSKFWNWCVIIKYFKYVWFLLSIYLQAWSLACLLWNLQLFFSDCQFLSNISYIYLFLRNVSWCIFQLFPDCLCFFCKCVYLWELYMHYDGIPTKSKM